MAERVAGELGVSGAVLPPGGELAEVARRAVASTRAGDTQRIYRAVRKVFRAMEPIPVPEPLARLAAIEKLKLFVTTTFDGVAERALDEARFDGQRQTLAFVYAPNDKQDLPPEFDRLSRPAVFYLMGRLSATPRSYAVTRDDFLEFTESLQSRAEDAPGFLFDKLAKSDLLFIGTRVADWLAHLFARNPKAARRVDAAAHGGSGGAGGAAARGDAPVVLVEHANGAARSYSGASASNFSRDLHERWTKLEASAAEAGPSPEPLAHLSRLVHLPPGAVILSCATVDRDETETIREALDRAGVDVFVDSDDVALAEKWEMKLRHCVSESSLFVPVLSSGSREVVPRRRWARSEWLQTVLADSFIVPFVLDDEAAGSSSLPEALRGQASRVEHLHDGKPSEDFVRLAVNRQREHRRASHA